MNEYRAARSACVECFKKRSIASVFVGIIFLIYKNNSFWVSGFWEGGTKGGDAGASLRQTETKRLRKETERLLKDKRAELDRIFNDVVETKEVLAEVVTEPLPSGLFPVIPLSPLFTLSPYSMEKERQSRKQIRAATQKAEAARDRRKALKARAVATAEANHNAAVARHEAATKAYEAEYMRMLAKTARMDLGFYQGLVSNLLGLYTEDDEKQLISMLR